MAWNTPVMRLIATWPQDCLFEVSFLNITWWGGSRAHSGASAICAQITDILDTNHNGKIHIYQNRVKKNTEGTIPPRSCASITTCIKWFHWPASCNYWKQTLKASITFWGSVKNLANPQKIEIWRVTINFGITMLTKKWTVCYGIINDRWDLL